MRFALLLMVGEAAKGKNVPFVGKILSLTENAEVVELVKQIRDVNPGVANYDYVYRKRCRANYQ